MEAISSYTPRNYLPNKETPWYGIRGVQKGDKRQVFIRFKHLKKAKDKKLVVIKPPVFSYCEPNRGIPTLSWFSLNLEAEICGNVDSV